MTDVSCPEKKAYEEVSLQDLREFLEENYTNYDDFAADLLRQLGQYDFDSEMWAFIQERMTEDTSPFNFLNFDGDINDSLPRQDLKG